MHVAIMGRLKGSYRNKNFITALIDQEVASFSICDTRKNDLRTRICEMLMLKECDVAYFPMMQHESRRKIDLAHKYGKKVITEFYVSLYDTFVLDRKVDAPDSPMAKHYWEADRYALLHSDYVIFLNQAEAEYYCSVLDVDIRQVPAVIIPLVNDRKPQAKLKYYTGQRDQLNLCWTGTYIPLQGLEKIIEAMEIIQKSGRKVHLFIWGSNDQDAKPYAELIQEKGLEDYITIHNEWGNMEAWSEFMVENCDVNMGIFGDSDKAKAVLANKVIDGIAFGCPVITGKSTGVSCYFDGCTDLFVTDNTPEAIADMIAQMYKKDWNTVQSHIARTTAIYEEIFSLKAYEQAIKKLLS